MLANVSSQMTRGGGEHARGRAADPGHQLGEIADRRDRDRDVADPVAEPVHVVGLEAGIRAEEVARVGVRPALLRIELAEFREREAERGDAGGGDQPAEDRDAADLRKVDRQQEHAGADHVAGHEHRGLRQRHLAAGRAHCVALLCARCRLQALHVVDAVAILDAVRVVAEAGEALVPGRTAHAGSRDTGRRSRRSIRRA